jgi:TrmH family RNA methyltransferase
MNDTHACDAAVARVLSRVRSLARREVRDSQKCCWIEGARHFIQAADAGFHFEAIVHSPVLLKSPVAEILARRLRAGGARYARVTPEQFRAVSTTVRASGIGAIVRQRIEKLGPATEYRGLGWLVIEQIRSPGNLGTILRTAEACGVGGVIFVGRDCDPWSPEVLRASMGGIFALPLFRASHEQVLAWATAHSVQLVGLSPDGAELWSDAALAERVAVAIGEERQGLSDSSKRLCHTAVRLPMSGRADSLNVSIAAGVMMYELVRRIEATRSC